MADDAEPKPEPEPEPEPEIDPGDVAVVAESEAELIRLARALVLGNAADVVGRAFRRPAMPPAISTACAQLLGDALAQVWPGLWRRSGALPIRVAEGDQTRKGRIWALRRPAALTFSTVTLQLLRWLLVAPPLQETRPARRGRRVREVDEVGVDRIAARDAERAGAALTIGDQVIGYLALEATAGTPLQARVAGYRPVREMALAWLGFADALAAERPADLLPHGPADDAAARADAVAGLAALTAGAGAVVVESLAGELGRRWHKAELAKRQVEHPAALVAVGAAQDAVLGAFMAACERADRRDLAGFVIDAAAPLLARGLAPAPGQLDRDATLALRGQARVAAGALLRGVMRWAAWDEAQRGVRFMDDDYAASQLLLARFEPIGAAGAAQAATWLSELAALPT